MNYYAFAIPSVPCGCQILTYSCSDLHVYKAHCMKEYLFIIRILHFLYYYLQQFIDPNLEETYPQFLKLNFTILPSLLRTTEEGREASS